MSNNSKQPFYQWVKGSDKVPEILNNTIVWRQIHTKAIVIITAGDLKFLQHYEWLEEVTNESGLTHRELLSANEKLTAQVEIKDSRIFQYEKENAELLEQRKELLEALEIAIVDLRTSKIVMGQNGISNTIQDNLVQIESAYREAKGKQ